VILVLRDSHHTCFGLQVGCLLTLLRVSTSSYVEKMVFRFGFTDRCLYFLDNGMLPRQQHGYVYRYPVDIDTSIHHFLKQSDMWMRLYIIF
jgi:hypothetical protein